jgi:hypothetical protein
MSKAWPVEGIDPDGSLEANARRILRVRVAEYYAFAPIVDQEFAIEALHDLRIAAKRLRYTLELFRSVFGEAGERNIGRVKAIQEALGNLHDTDVRIELVSQELLQLAAEQLDEMGRTLATAPEPVHRAIVTSALRPPPDDPRRGLYALLSRQHLERHEHYAAFHTLWRQFEAEGMRAELAALSTSLTGRGRNRPASVEPVVHMPATEESP